jgi:hypothetical protein
MYTVKGERMATGNTILVTKLHDADGRQFVLIGWKCCKVSPRIGVCANQYWWKLNHYLPTLVQRKHQHSGLQLCMVSGNGGTLSQWVV